MLVLDQAEAQPTLSDQSERVITGLAEILRAQLALALRRAILHRDLTQLARLDPLTEVDRRWYGQERLSEILCQGPVVVALPGLQYLVVCWRWKMLWLRLGHGAW